MPAGKKLDIKVKVDTRQAKTALGSAAKDVNKIGKAGQKAAADTKRAWSGVSASFKGIGTGLVNSLRNARGGLAAMVSGTKSLEKGFKGALHQARQLRAITMKGGAGGIGGAGGAGGGGLLSGLL